MLKIYYICLVGKITMTISFYKFLRWYRFFTQGYIHLGTVAKMAWGIISKGVMLRKQRRIKTIITFTGI